MKNPAAIALQLVLLACIPCSARAQAQLLVPVDPDYSIETFAFGVSADGTTVVGSHVYGISQNAFVWTAKNGLEVLPKGRSSYAGAFAVSADGAVVAGNSQASSIWRRTSDSYPTYELSDDDLGNGAQITAISADGAVAVGHGERNSIYGAPYYTHSGVTQLGTLGGTPSHDFFSHANGVSADGKIVVGISSSPTGSQAFRWTAATGMQGLSSPDDEVSFFNANAISGNGNVVVGVGGPNNNRVAVRWTAETGTVNLGRLGPEFVHAEAWAVLADGSTVVGNSTRTTEHGPQDSFAFIWREGTGMLPLQHVLADYGVDMSRWRLDSARGVSADGRVIVGYGKYSGEPLNRAFVAILPVPEPSTCLLFVLASLTSLILRRR